MAQLVEQLIRNQQVAGSSPATSSKKILVLCGQGFFYFFLRFLLTNALLSAIIKLLRFSSF